VVVDQTNLLGPRRGFDLLSGSLPLVSDRLNRGDVYQGLADSQAYIVGHWGSSKFGYYSAGTWTAFSGTFSPPDPVLARTRFLQQNNNFYFTTSNGIYKLDSVEHSTPKLAGVAKGLDVQLSTTGSSGFFSQNSLGTFTGTVTNASPTITNLTSIPGTLATGQYLSDTNSYIPAGTTVSSITSPALALTTTIATQAGSYQILIVGASTGIAVGQIVSASNSIPSNSTVTALSGSTATTTGNTHTSTTIDNLASMTGIVVGMFVTGSGVTAGTIVTGVNTAGSSVTISQATSTSLVGTSLTFNIPASVAPTGTVANGSTSMTAVSSISGIVVGMAISGTSVPSGTVVTAVSGTTVTMSQAATGANTGTYTFTGTVHLISQTATGSNITTSPLTAQFTNPGTITMSANATGSASETITYSAGGQVAYRLLWGYKDANNNVILGAPTQWNSISNTTGSSRQVQVTSSIPQGITTAYFYQVFRSTQTSTASITPSDDMQLCYEANPNNTDLSNGYVTFTDNLPNALLGASLYTSPSQSGIGQAYAQPPVCKDFCSFYGYVLYANLTYPQSINLTILGTGSPNGIQLTDTLTIDGIVFTAGGAVNIATNTYQLYTSGTPAQNIANTCNSLMNVINRSATSTVYAYGISGPTDLPGQMVITARTFGNAAFALTASAHGTTAFNPALPTSGTTVSSSQTIYKNGVLCSVQNQPESAPPANLLPLFGSASANILRVIALRDYVVILKEDGVFRIVGNSLANFNGLPFDITTVLVAPDSAVALNNQVWCLANQGVVSISDTGVQQQSWTNINNIIQQLFGTAYSETQRYASAVAYQTDHKYILGLPSGAGDTGNTQTLTYNIFTNAWTKWTRQFTSGFIHPTQNILYLGNFQNSNVVTERKTGTYQDFIDEASVFPNIVSYSNYTVTLNSIVGINVGDLLYQDSTHASVITAIDSTNNTVTVQYLVTWSVASATIYPAIGSTVQWKPIVAGNPGFLRQYSEGDLLFNTTRFTMATIAFSTDLYQSLVSVPLTGFAIGSWGLFPWDGVPWGGGGNPLPLRFYVPLNCQLASQLNPQFSIYQAWSNWSLTGLNLVYQDINQELDG
jgi:hypothetical protein